MSSRTIYSFSKINLFAIFLLTAFSFACNKGGNMLAANHPPKADSSTTTQPVVPAPPVTVTPQGRTFLVGKGSGDLLIDGNNFVMNGAKMNLQNGDSIKIQGGSYNSISVQNISVPDGNRVTIANAGLISLDGTDKMLTLSNLNNVTVSGGGVNGMSRGFAFLNNSYRAVILEGTINNFTLQNMLFKNIGDYVIYYNDLDKLVYDGSAQSYRSNIAFLNLDGENINTFINLPGDISNSNFTGLLRNVEVGHISCINSPGIGIVVSLGACEDYNVHDNLINNINSQNDNHNGIFMLSGNGKFYNNTVKNHQGNAIRAWLYSVSSPKTVEIYNNIVYNSRKYSAFEVQVPPYVKASPLFKPANAKVYNNTAGQMNTSLSSFPGRLLDLYNTYGTLEFYNNLAFANNDAELINDMSDTKITVNSNNVYKAALGDAVVNSTNLNSKIPGVGATAAF
ncbi:hypothetical protein [Niabella soli]|uniref:Right handed beta helix domain-containing protein n=1 Tax=Niabella soli DSM 19437 TaxID=929713 RepID=W0F233_9BACT|nr:hypothetical protein [Niabella soli]AHF17062.1 hypothetical protein NIASO_01075 [Niabella soli DSM 19437]